MQIFRNNGAVGAILDEYERALNELMDAILEVSKNDLVVICDPNTEDKDCRSIQTILTHVVQSGYTYVVEIRKWLNEEVSYYEKVFYNDVNDYKDALRSMFRYTEKLFDEYPNIFTNDVNTPDKPIQCRWGEAYSAEQLMEHAIVHILRHRRQIEKFIQIIAVKKY